jgi:hypothetical protein
MALPDTVWDFESDIQLRWKEIVSITTSFSRRIFVLLSGTSRFICVHEYDAHEIWDMRGPEMEPVLIFDGR